MLTFVCLQFAFNTLQRVNPVSHGVCNVVKRVAIIVTSVLFFGTPLSTKTKIGKPGTLLPGLQVPANGRITQLPVSCSPCYDMTVS